MVDRCCSGPIGGVTVFYFVLSFITALPAIHFVTQQLAALLHLPPIITCGWAIALILAPAPFLLRAAGIPWVKPAVEQAPIGRQLFGSARSRPEIGGQLDSIFGSPAASTRMMASETTPSSAQRRAPKGRQKPIPPIGTQATTAERILAQVHAAGSRLQTSERRLAKQIGRHPSAIGPALRCLERQGLLFAERSGAGTVLRLPTWSSAQAGRAIARPLLQ
jgi:hypothetical protein